MTNRRNFLKNTSLIAAGSLLAGKMNVAKAMHSPISSGANATKNFGLQTYSLQGELAADVPGGLKKVSQMGYTTLELSGYNIEGRIGAVPIAEFKKYADDAGLKIVSTHVGAPGREYTKDNLEQFKEFWKKAMDDHAAIGCKYFIQPSQPTMRSTEDVAFVGEVYNEAGKIAKAAGLIFAYHNHAGEFARVVPGGTGTVTTGGGGQAPQGGGGQAPQGGGGQAPQGGGGQAPQGGGGQAPQGGGQGRGPQGVIIYDALLEATDPALVQFETDVYWTVMGQQDPVAYMRRYPDRIRLLHIKDIAVLGESGMMNFQKIFETAYANNISDFFVELERYSGGTQFEGVEGCANYLLNAPFVK